MYLNFKVLSPFGCSKYKLLQKRCDFNWLTGIKGSQVNSPIKNYLESNAFDLGTPGKDNIYGSGLVRLPAPPQPNLTPYLPDGWSDKIVVSKTMETSTDSSPLYNTDTLYVDWAVSNDGPVAISNSFSVALHVDGMLKNSWYSDSLMSGYYTYISDYQIGSLSAGTHTIKIVADSTGVINESNEGDNEYTKTITIQSPHQSETISTPNAPTGATNGTTGTSYTYFTGGASSNLGHSVQYRFDWGDGTYSDWSSATTASKSWGSAGTYPVKVLARCATHTSVESNWSGTLSISISSVPVQKPNLTPHPLSSSWSDRIVVSNKKKTTIDSNPIYSTDFLYLDWAVINNGRAAISSRFWTALYVDGVEKSKWYKDSLGIGFHTYVFDYPLGSLSAGTHKIEIVTDADGNIDESDEGDNEYTKTVTVLLAGPDLTGSWSTSAQSCRNSYSGLRCTIKGTLTVTNAGNRDTYPLYVYFYLSDNDIYEGGDALLKSVSAGKIKKGLSRAIKFTYNFPTGKNATGKYIIAVIDKGNLVAELNETNNTIVFGPIP